MLYEEFQFHSYSDKINTPESTHPGVCRKSLNSKAEINCVSGLPFSRRVTQDRMDLYSVYAGN